MAWALLDDCGNTLNLQNRKEPLEHKLSIYSTTNECLDVFIWFFRESYFSSLVEQGRISVTLEGVNSVLRSTSFCVVTLAPASPSCCSMCTTWSPEASTPLEKAPVQLASQPMWWKTLRPGSLSSRQVPLSWVTTVYVASMNLTKWVKAQGPCCMRSWSSRLCPLQRWVLMSTATAGSQQFTVTDLFWNFLHELLLLTSI